MQVFEVTGRAVRREKFNTVWRCGAPWPTTDKQSGVSSVTHQLRLYRKASDPQFDELVIKDPVIDEETGEPKMLKVKNAKGDLVDGSRPMLKVRQSPGTGAPVRRPLKWCLREDGSRVVECYADTFELAKGDNLFDLLDTREVPNDEVVSIENAENGSNYEKVVAASKPRRIAKR